MIKVLIFVVTVVNYVPFQELSSLSCLLQPNPSLSTLSLIYQVTSKLINFNPTYRKIFQEAGLLHMLIALIKQYSPFILENSTDFSYESFQVTMKCTSLILHKNIDNVKIFRDSGCPALLFSFLKNDEARQSSLIVINELIDSDLVQEYRDIQSLISLLQPKIESNNNNNNDEQSQENKNAEMNETFDYQTKFDILNAIMRAFVSNEKVKDNFRERDGYLYLLSLLKETAADSLVISDEHRCSLITNIFKTITVSILTYPKNRNYFRENIVYNLKIVFENTNILSSSFSFDVLCNLLSVATEDINPIWDPERLLVFNPEVLVVIFELFSETQIETKVAILQRILQIISLGKRNQEPLCAIGLLDFILSRFREEFLDSNNPLQPLLLSFIEQLGMHRITPGELKQFIRFIEKKDFPPLLLTSLSRMANNCTYVPYIEFDLHRLGYACLHLPSFGDRSWPPANGYTVLFWLYIDTLDGYSQLNVFNFISDDKKSNTLIYIQEEKLVLQTSSKSVVEFPFEYHKKQWYHIALVHTRSRFQTSEAKLYIDGELKHTTKSPYIAATSGNVGAYIGTPPDKLQMSDSIWRIGPCYLIEEIFTWDMVLICFCLGPRYTGNFQGQFCSYSSYTPITSRTLAILEANESQNLIMDLSTSFTIPEERVIFSLNANNVKQITKSDSYSNQVFQGSIGLTVYNSADLNGVARGLLTGGCMALSPSGISTGICKIGGVLVVFLLIEKADTSESLLDTISLLVVLVRDNPRISREMERLKGYPLLADFLYKKRALITVQILEKLLELTGIIPVRRNEDPIISNYFAFRYVILYFQLWKWTPVEVQVAYFRRINSLMINNSQAKFNILRMRKLHLLPKLLYILKEEVLDPDIIDWVSIVITNYVSSELQEDDLHSMTSFLVATLDPSKQTEPEKNIRNTRRRRAASFKKNVTLSIPIDVKIRNIILEIIINQLTKADNMNIFNKIITIHWIFLFLEKSLHYTTIILGLKIVIMMLQSKGNFKGKFIDAMGYGLLSSILPHFYDKPALYYLLFALLLGKQIPDLPVDISSLQLSFADLVETFRSPVGNDVTYHIAAIEVLPVLFSLLKRLCTGSVPALPSKYINWNIPGCDANNSQNQNLSESQPPPGKYNLREHGVNLYKWKITDKDYEIQQSVFPFISHIYENSPEFQDLLSNDKTGERLANILLPLFPHNQLNFPPNNFDLHQTEEENRCHSSAKYIFEFLQAILVNTALNVNGKLVNLFDQILDATPVNIIESQFILLQSKLLCDFVTFVKSLPKETIFDKRNLAVNISKFCSYLVDKVCSGLFAHGGKFTFNFLVELLEKLEGVDISYGENQNKIATNLASKSKMKAEVQMIYRALNRTTIQILGVPHGKTREDFMYVIQTTIFHQQIVLNLWNNDNEFIFVVCHLLYKFLLDDNKQLREGAMNVWKLLLLTKPETINDILVYKPAKGDIVDLREGFNLLLNKDFNQFYFWMGDAVQTISIHTVLEEQLSNVWLAFQESENKIRIEHLKQSKSRRAIFNQKIENIVKGIQLHLSKMETWRNSTILTTKEKIFVKFKKTRQEDIDLHKYLQTRWSKIKSRFYRERSVWGSDVPSHLDKWELDYTEGPFRMRKKFKRNYKFYDNFPYVDGLLEGQHSAKIPTSFDSKEHYNIYGGKIVYYVDYKSSGDLSTFISSIDPQEIERYQQSLSVNQPKDRRKSESRLPSLNLDLLGDNSGTVLNSPQTPNEHDRDSTPLLTSPRNFPSEGNVEQLYSSLIGEDPEKQSENEITINENEFTFLGDSSEFEEIDDFDFEEEDNDEEDKIKRLLDAGDMIEYPYNCGRIDGMINNPAIFLICTNNLYLIDDYKITEDGEITEINENINYNSNSFNSNSNVIKLEDNVSNVSHQIRKWSYEDIRDIFRRRFLLRPVAIEIFSNDGRNFLVTFEPVDFEKAFKNLEIKLSKSGVSLEDISGSQIELLGSPTKKFFKKDVTQKWVQGQISNFQYLMHLNTVAGRSYNDLTQYPVFPWVLSDFESEELDLSNPTIYRDLSKPMGGLSSERAKEFQQRFENWEPKENMGVPKWHYGSHYSSAGIVLYYLIRLEPFVDQFLKFLQSGRFDVADRLFHSINECWLSASGATNNMSDVKELIPEFYYLPELFENRNKFDFGIRQTMERVDDVVLPPWAKNSAHEFVRIHRQALESDFVSANLHEWIDLIFGYKQKGKPAEENLNVFYHLTYEGSVNIDAIKDPIEKDSVIAQINNFGQTPKQLFTKPHPKKQISPPSSSIDYSYTNNNLLIHILISPKREIHFFRDIGKSVGFLKMISNEKVTNRVIALPHNRICLPTKNYNKYIAWGYLDLSLRIYMIENDKLVTVLENIHDSQITCACTTEDGKYLITGGNDTVVAVHKIKKNRGRYFELQQLLSGHNQSITSIAVSRSYSVIVTSSEDRSIIVLYSFLIIILWFY